MVRTAPMARSQDSRSPEIGADDNSNLSSEAKIDRRTNVGFESEDCDVAGSRDDAMGRKADVNAARRCAGTTRVGSKGMRDGSGLGGEESILDEERIVPAWSTSIPPSPAREEGCFTRPVAIPRSTWDPVRIRSRVMDCPPVVGISLASACSVISILYSKRRLQVRKGSDRLSRV